MFDPYGKVTVLDGNGTPRTVNESLYGNPWTFTGRRLDQETGLMQFRFRYYDTGLGRFIGRDPLGYVDGGNLYAGYFAPLGVDPAGLGFWQWLFDWPEEVSPPVTVVDRAAEDRKNAQPPTAQQPPAHLQGWRPLYPGEGFRICYGHSNCIGYATEAGGAIYSINYQKGSLFDFVTDRLKLDCTVWTGKTADECVKHCGECKFATIIYVYKYAANPESKDPIRDPWIKSLKNDFHGFKHTSEGWSYVPRREKYVQEPIKGGPTEYGWDEDYQRSKPSLCCCKGKK